MKKILTFLFAGTTSILMSACYGVVSDYNDYGTDVEVTTIDTYGDPIPELKVTINCDNESKYGYTDDYGYVNLYVSENLNYCNLEIDDVDGEDNFGTYESETIPMNSSQTSYSVTMELE